MKEFEFDDIEISDEKEEPIKEETVNPESDPLYQKFSFDIDEEPIKEEIEEENIQNNNLEVNVNDIFGEETSINNLFEEKEELGEEQKPLFSSSSNEIDNPFANEEPKQVVEEPKVEENVFEEANKEVKPIISYSDEEIENKEDALEEALSHTTKLTPFKDEKPNISEMEVEETKEGKETNGIAYLIALFIVLLIAIFVIPKIASLL